MARVLIVLSTLAIMLSACADTPDPRSLSCASQAHGGLPWGYYPGYGCGPVPRAQTKYP